MSDVMERPDIDTFRRVTLVDLSGMADWLIARLQERHPTATSAQIVGWLRSCMDNNEFWFVCTDHTCALAGVRRVPLEPFPVAEEIFVFARPGHEDDAEPLYRRMASWAAHQEATILRVDVHTDVTRSNIRATVGAVIAKPHVYLRLDRQE